MSDTARRLIDMTDVELRALIREEMQREPERDEVLTRGQAADLLGVHKDALLKRVKNDGLPAHKIGRDWRFKRSELLAWLETRGIEHATKPTHWGPKIVAVTGPGDLKASGGRG